MFFKADAPLEQITEWIATQLSAVHPIAKNGIDIVIKPHKQWRTTEQNRFLMVVLSEIVKFYHETGFIPEGLKRWEMRVDFLKEFYKDKYGIEHTKTLDKKEFGKFIDSIQLELVEQTQGEWQILTTDSAYLSSLTDNI